ncbi:D-alanine--D-alanine ligase family protein [Psychrobacter sanguinis]|uniref:D-alanine--D-alanine ligase family protein n=1 Tax=Psychrobacter sanguinis TaxID=861445 RepID=UPI0019197442|nr:D-alanine--D-alanine ligase family protein [Psychrobacter sanguinis]MCC3307871.1 D-alanine--D-alanine ligase [Psychrobacter sanguinis]UEC25168.1 D-alanine--D-alanine ligase [Psychrobacter sanguinis]
MTTQTSSSSQKKHVAIILGGQSPEHAVSINSGCSLLNHIDRNRFNVEAIYIDIEGRWWQYPHQESYTSDIFTIETAQAIAQRCVIIPDETYQLVKLPSLEKIVCDVCFSIVHGSTGEDGKLQGVFEVANLPYVGTDVAGSAVGMNKVIMKDILNANDIPTANYRIVDARSWKADAASLIEDVRSLKLPIFVKPANTGSSVGISKVDSYDDLQSAIEVALKFDPQVLVEEGITPARELEVAVLGNHNPEVSCIGEINPPDGFYDYASKYLNDTAKLSYPATVEPEVEAKMRDIAVKTYKVLGLKGLSRVDFLLDQATNEPYIIEVNTLPGFTNISMYPKLWDVSGKPYSTLITELIELALDAHKDKQQRQLDFARELSELQKSAH